METKMHEPIIDYISISIPYPKLLESYALHFDYDHAFYSDDRTFDIAEYLAAQTNFQEMSGKSVFDRRIQFPDIGCMYWEGNKSNVSLLQITGHGCEILREKGILNNVLHAWQDRLTRIDIATDITCDIDPEDFAYAHTNARFKVTQFIDKISGITYYVGSKDSDRYARVYRYRSPHPRSGQLRLEYQLSDKQAKFVAARICETSLLQVSDELGNTFGWSHPVYVQSLHDEKIPSAPRPETKGNTVFWLYKQVLPALRKSAEKGDLETLIAFESSLKAIIDEYSDLRKDK